MLPILKRYCLCGLLLFCATLTQGEEVKSPFKKAWAARPAGNYEFLQFPYSAEKEAAIKAALPIRRIKLRIWGAPDILNGLPAANYYIEFHVTGKALLHAISGTEKNGVYNGQIDLTDYARLCLLYETLISETKDPAKYGFEINSSHPVISELTITFTDNKPTRRHRNDANFGDFKFWVFENVLENIESKVNWKQVEAN